MQTPTPNTKMLLWVPPQQPNINRISGGCIHKVYALLRKSMHNGLWGNNEVQGYDNAMGKKKGVDFIFTGCITASVKISLSSLPAPNNADSLCKK